MKPTLRDRLLAISDEDHNSLEELTRTLLVLLEAVVGLDSVYLTRIDEARRYQKVLFAHNAAPERLAVAEGLAVAWEDTVCRRAFQEETPLTQHADVLWGDLDAVRALNLRTYLGTPVRDAGGTLLGTLCGVSDRRVMVDPESQRVVGLIARLIAHQFQRERQLMALKRQNQELSSRVSVLAERETADPLTGIANRRGLTAALARALAEAARGDGRVAVVFIDLDRFKVINDLYGHKVGDSFLVAMARRLAAATRRGELVARYGGDEFVAVVRLGLDEPDAAVERQLGERFALATRGRFTLGEVAIEYEGASVGVAVSRPAYAARAAGAGAAGADHLEAGSADAQAHAPESAEALLHRADAAMYAVKKAGAKARQEWLFMRTATLGL